MKRRKMPRVHTVSLSDRIQLREIKLVHRHQTIRQHQESRFVENGESEKVEKIFVAELLQVGLAIFKRRFTCIPS